ncbi:hypothetical protein GYB59_14430 [bacterium]|nr:hypothetical protein [bacterium]
MTTGTTDWELIVETGFALMVWLPSKNAKHYAADVVLVHSMEPTGNAVHVATPDVVRRSGDVKRLRWKDRKRIPLEMVLRAEPLRSDFASLGNQAYIDQVRRAKEWTDLKWIEK